MKFMLLGKEVILASIEEVTIAMELQKIGLTTNTLPKQFTFNQFCRLDTLKNVLLSLGYDKNSIVLKPFRSESAFYNTDCLEYSHITEVLLN